MRSNSPILAIDYGERRVGLAINIPGMDFVSGLPTIDRKVLKRSLTDELAALVAEREVERVVIGI
ncbi:MAG: Holliday junction resolvase RuvX, partial [Gemmatimonadota bacterium]